MATIRDQILDAIEARLKTIVTGNAVTVQGESYTYVNNLSSRVFRERLTAFEDAELPAVNIVPGAVTRDDERSEIGRPLRVFPVSAIVLDDNRPSTSIDDLVNDVLACVGSDPRWGNLARWTNYELGEIDHELLGKNRFGVSVDLEVTYRSKPFAI